jgi:DNA-directed RNA polymerase subunit RPC12/RpoP
MDATVPTTSLHCTQCGGELHPDEGQIFLTCPYCGAAVFVDKSQVVFHWYLAPTLDEDEARASLARWMAGNQTVKDLDKKARLLSNAFEYFPVWYFKRQPSNGGEAIIVEPAAATSVSELRNLQLPAGDLRTYDPALDGQAQKPTVPLEAALEWMVQRQLPAGEINEQSLVHIPLYTFKYAYQGTNYTAVVEAGTGGVFANIYPAKAEAPYRLAGGLAALVFLCLATIPLIGYAVNDSSGLGIGLLVCSGLGVIAAPLLFALAAWVAAKV